jgi:hypothetical protein
MKHLLMGAVLILLVTGCHTTGDSGRPADEAAVETGGEASASYQQGPNDRYQRSRISNNLGSGLSR